MDNCCWPSWKNNKLFTVLAVLVMAGIFVFLGTLVANNLKSYNYIGKPSAERDTIAISGEGKVTGIPDIATINVGLTTEKSDVQSAQAENTKKMNQLIANLKNLGVASVDIQTSDYNIYPQYDYPNGGPGFARLSSQPERDC